MELPVFKYHPDPLATGSIVPSVKVCPVCKESRGFAYDGIPYGTNDLEHICLWCIADGSAHEKFGVEFTAADEVVGMAGGRNGELQHLWERCLVGASDFLLEVS